MQIRRRRPRVLIYNFGFQPPLDQPGETDSPGEGGNAAPSPPDSTELNSAEEAAAPPEPPTLQE